MIPANSELVVEAWLASVSGLAGGQVGTTLPGTLAWRVDGFVVIAGVVGGSGFGDDDGAIRNPVVQLDAYAVPATATDETTTGKPPWGKAAQLLEVVRAGCFDATGGARDDLVLKSGYRRAVVLGAWPVSEPRRMRDEPNPVARYTMDLSLLWAELPE